MKKNNLPFKKLIFLLFFPTLIFAQLGVNSDNSAPSTNAMLDVKSPTKGILIPRVGSDLASPTEGLLYYNTTGHNFRYYDGTAWQNALFGNQWNINGTSISYSLGNVGIGTTTPLFPLSVVGDARISGKLAVNDPAPDYNLDVNGNAGIDNLGVGVAPDAAYPLKAAGTTFLVGLLVTSTANFSSTVNVTGTLNANSNLAVDGNITTNAGAGIVRSTDSNQLAIDDFATPANLTWNLNPGQSVCCVGIGFSTFVASPSIAFGETTGATNPGHVVYTIESIDTNSASIRVSNVGNLNSTASGSGRFRAMIIGRK